MPRFLQSMIFLLGVGLLVLSTFLVVIRQQEPMQYFYVLAHEPNNKHNSMSLVLWHRDGQDVRFAPMPVVARGLATSSPSPVGRWYAVVASSVNGSHLYLARFDSQYVISLDSPDVMFSYSAAPRFS